MTFKLGHMLGLVRLRLQLSPNSQILVITFHDLVLLGHVDVVQYTIYELGFFSSLYNVCTRKIQAQ
jgi:hypothetical protein